MRKPILAYIPALARHQGVNAAHPISQILSVRRTSEATRINRDGLIEQVSPELPRQDWEDSNCPSLLMEPERTNYATNNTSMDSYSALGGSNPSPTLTADYITAPDGTLTATRFQASTTGSSYSLIQFPTTASGNGDYTASVYVKSNTGQNQTIAFYGQSSSPNTREVTTEWTRIEFTGNRGAGLTKFAYLGTWNSNLGSDADLDISIWGAQLEVDCSYASSLIYTDGSTATRTKDYATGWSGSWISDADLSEGSFFVDATHFEDPLNAYCQITLSDGGSNFIRNIYENGRVRTTAWNGTSQFDYFDTGADEDQRNKILFTFKENEFKLYRAGQLITTDSSGAVPTGLSRLDLSDQYGSGRFFEGKIHDIRVFDYVLSEAEAIKLTS
jgi:hypothetical protein